MFDSLLTYYFFSYDTQLDDLRNVYDELESFLTKAAHQILEVVPLLESVSVEYVPLIGYLVVIKTDQAHFLAPYMSSILPSSTNNSRHGARSNDNNQSQQQYHNTSISQRDNDEYKWDEEVRVGGSGNEGNIDWQGNNRSQQTDQHDWIRNQIDGTEDSINNNNNENDDNDTGIKYSEGFYFVYAQGEFNYYKHDIVTDLDERVGDIQSSIKDRQRVLLLEIEDELLDAEPYLQRLAAMLSSLDAILSLGCVAYDMDFVRPQIVDEPLIIIKGGKHLLQELAVEGDFVPNDTYLDATKNIALITGPNSSGKSVYLKQVGLLVYLAHIGSWLPCQKAVIGLTDRILTRISSCETVSAAQSSFSLDLTQVAKMIKSHTSRSLCLIDEFGKGTTPVDGIALLATTIKHFTKTKGRAIFALHFTEVSL